MFHKFAAFLRRLFTGATPSGSGSARESDPALAMELLLQPKSIDVSCSNSWDGPPGSFDDVPRDLQTVQTDIGYFVDMPPEEPPQQIVFPEHREQISRDDFARLLLDKAKEIKPEVVFDYDAKEYALKSRNQEQQVMYLHNAHLEYNRCSVEEQPYVLKKWLRHLLFIKQIPDDFEDVVPDLLPALRTRGYFELTQLRFREQGRSMPYFPYQDVGERFGLTVAYDMHDSIIMISQKHLDDWNLSFYEAMEIAMRNLLEKGFTLTCLKLEDRMMVYIPTAGDSFDGTRLMLTEQIRELDVIGDTVAMILSADTMMITGSEDQLGLGFFLSQAAEFQDKPHAIPPILLRLDGDEWTQWLPPASSEYYLPFKRFRIVAEGTDYAEQSTILSSLFKKEGRNITIGHYFVAQREASKQMFTYAVWSDEGKDILMPKTEFIAFTADGKSTPTLIPWDVACDVVGYLMDLKYEYPPRYLVGVFPTSREIAEMQARSVDKDPFSVDA